jgi:PDZ domain-containing protein
MRRLSRSRRLALLGVLALVLGGTAVGLWLTPSDEYLFLPGHARPVAPLVEVEDGQTTAASDDSGIYMVDILVRRANLLEKLIPGVKEGADVVPEQALNPHGVTDQQRTQTGQLDMTRSQQIAAAVALRSLGYDVTATPSGAEIETVIPDTPASGELEPGDVIVRANGGSVETPEDLRSAMETVEPGDEIEISYRRDGELTELTLGTQASVDDPKRAVIGVIVQQAASIELPLDVEIDDAGVIGPSAGLAFALDIVDELGTEVDRGRRIVVTGELGLDGSVNPIGGVKQKVIGAEQAGADVFVVPEDNAEEARQYADGIQVVAVESFDEALNELGVEPEPVT